jgi:hypothetical protein
MVHLMMKLLTMKLRVAWKAYGIQVETTTEGPKQLEVLS